MQFGRMAHLALWELFVDLRDGMSGLAQFLASHLVGTPGQLADEAVDLEAQGGALVGWTVLEKKF